MADILIIDDEEEGAAALAGMLRRRGHTADFVTTVPAGLARLRQNPPGIAILDIGMPDFSGLEMLEAISKDPRFEDLRVAAISGNPDPAVEARALRLGACDFIPKSLTMSQICRRIEEQL